MSIETVTVVLDGMTFIVTGDFVPGHPGKLFGLPEDCYPSEPAKFDIIKVKGFSANGVPLVTTLDPDDEREEALHPDDLELYMDQACDEAYEYLDGE